MATPQKGLFKSSITFSIIGKITASLLRLLNAMLPDGSITIFIRCCVNGVLKPEE
jgi:hypothetical protein